MMEKVIPGVRCSLEVVLAWYISADYSPCNSYGYNHNQLVFGHNPNFPSVIQNKIPALEGVMLSKLVVSPSKCGTFGKNKKIH